MAKPTTLGRRAVGALVLFLLALFALVFAPGRTLAYWQGWAYLGLFAAATATITGWLWRSDRALLERRLQAGAFAEREPAQRVIQGVAQVAFLLLVVLSPLDHRFGWSDVSTVASLAGLAMVAGGFFLVFLTFRANTFTAATVQVAQGQHVIATGPYAAVRHPMYAGALLLLFGTPPALGSWWGEVPAVALAAVIVWRLLDEERFLRRNLAGYGDYCQRVRARLFPFVW